MEHREPSRRIGDDAATRTVATPTLRSLEGPRSDRPRPDRIGIDRRRAAIAVAAVIVCLIGLYLVERAGSAARQWLADQPAYQLDFRAIELIPPPPSWYRGGTARFLEDVRHRSGMPERFPVLRLRKDELKHVFERSPWTEEVPRVAYRPLGVTVQLSYHRPVAIVETTEGGRYLVDRSAIILPADDLAVDLPRFAAEQGLILIKGRGLAEPWNPKPGLPWETRPGLADVSEGSRRIKSAAKLAGFLLDKLRPFDRKSEPALDFAINPMDGRGLFLWNAESASYIFWGQAPGEESEGAPGAAEKWEILRDWSRTEKQRNVPVGDFWEITKSGVHRVPPPAPESARIAPAVKDASAFRAKAPGHRTESLSR
jgi:hypothetical protein